MGWQVLIHVNEPERWPVALGNIANFLNDVGEGNAAVIVVANGAGVRGYVEEKKDLAAAEGTSCSLAGPPLSHEDLAKRGVTFTACANALKAQGIDEGEMPGFVRIVPAGMTEMVRLQAEGYAYIKP